MTLSKKPINPTTPESRTAAPNTSAPKQGASQEKITSTMLVAASDVKDLVLPTPMAELRGWKVTGPGAATLGTVDHIMLDRAEKKPRYLTVALPEARGKLMLPIGVGTVNAKTKQVMLDDVKPEVMKALPTLTEDLITPEFERQVVVAVTGEQDASYTPHRWYRHPAFDPAKLFEAPSKPTV